MIRIRQSLGILLTGCLGLTADIVELQDGTRIEGTILAENDDSIEIEIGTNDRGTIRRVLIIDASEISTWMADAAGRIPGREDTGINRLGGQAYIDRLIAEAQKKIDAEEYDDGIRQFGEAAELAGRDVDKLELADQAVLLEKKAYAYRLQLAALKGKEHLLKEGPEGIEDRLEEMQRSLERDIRDFQSDKEDYLDKISDGRRDRIGSRREQSELDKRQETLVRRQNEFVRYRDDTLSRLREMQQELIETQMQMELAEERVDQAEDDARRAERRAR